jgi:hypothetical protein
MHLVLLVRGERVQRLKHFAFVHIAHFELAQGVSNFGNLGHTAEVNRTVSKERARTIDSRNLLVSELSGRASVTQHMGCSSSSCAKSAAAEREIVVNNKLKQQPKAG